MDKTKALTKESLAFTTNEAGGTHQSMNDSQLYRALP